ncbi:hypothetical protein D3C75_1279020 [compost metagenome]
MPDHGEQEDNQHRRLGKREHNLPVRLERSCTVNPRRLLQHIGHSPVELDEDEDEQSPLQPMAEQRRHNKRQMGVDPSQIAEK